MSTKKMAASIIAIMMVVAIFVTTAAAFTAPNAKNAMVEFEYGVGDCDGLYVNERSCDRQVNIVHKDGDWNVIDDTENGVLTYQLYGNGALTYNYDTPLTGYALFVPDCETGGASGWIDGMGQPGKMLSMTGVDDISAQLGFVDDGADYNGEVYGAKIWYVPTTLVTDNSGTDYCDWNLNKMLFEEELIVLTAPSLRIYGEDSVDAAFPYTDPEGPFGMNDEAPGKDFVVFNPAYIDEYDYDGVITVDGSNGREKVFVRQWYVPEYPEPRGDVWTQQDTVYSADIVTEYSFMLLNAQNKPAPGTAQQSGTGAYWTNFWLPIGSDGAQIGLDSFVIEPGSDTNRMVQLKAVGDFNGDGMKDIDITTRDTLLINHLGWFQFLDHAIEVVDITYDSTGHVIGAVVDLYYLGNRNINEVTTDDLIVANLHLNVGGQQVIAGRHTHIVGANPSFTLPWYLEVESIGLQGVYLKVGRLLHMGETFFVDGAEYDIAMVYGPNDDDFKYITIRNPTPKLEDVWLDDLSINKEHVPRCTVLPMLPPFNMGHTMVDDINLPNCYTGCPVDEVCDIISDDLTDLTERQISVDPLEVMWAKEDTEPRFHTNLLEILKEPEEIWQWIHIHIMPDQYTEMVYPPLPDAIVCTLQETLPGDFLLVSSWEAPNSCNDRMKFAYDATDSSDIYVNEQNDCGINSVRIYGEGGIDAAFPYTDPEGPFNKLSVDTTRKDFVTFNPAYIDEYDYDGVITVSGNNGREKVFVRQWYVPEYPEPRGDVWTQQDTVHSADIVTEYSFMLLNAQNMPTPGTAQQSGTGAYWTNFWLPIGSDGGQIGLDSFVIESGSDTNRMVQLKAVGDFNGDGMKDIDITTRDTLLINHLGWFQFLDHAIDVVDISYDSEGNVIDAIVDLYYIGNNNINEVTTDDLIVANLHLDVGGQQVIAGRHTHVVGANPSFTLPWYLEVESIGLQGVYLKVGRLLHMNETFFVDGAEYDIAMVYGPNDDDFKYITIRNPTPKLEDVWLDDLSINKEHVPRCTVLPMLPPFNMVHAIVDDIGIPHFLSYCEIGDTMYDEPNGINACADTVAERIVTGEPAFVSYFVEETVEERFRTNLLEILDEDTTESWDMLCMWTLPWNYTAMVYPQVGDCACSNDPNADFLVTTSGPKDPVGAECKGDFDGSGCVDFDDFVEFAGVYGSTAGDGVYNSLGDFDDDDDVDFDDFVEFAGVYGTGPNCP